MRKIIFIFLFFCLAITTVVAQVATINIATPYSNGLSNNQVDDFDVNTDGTILNNSASGGTSQLGNTAVTANTNISAGSEANLILFQVTTTSASSLNGQIEVFGSEAGVIIANPNGITCDGCGFINTSKVDLVTGTANFSGDDLTSFSIYDAARLIVSGNGFVSDAVADELNLVSRTLIIKAQVKANTTLRILAGNDTYDHTTNIITSDTTEATAHSIQINASGSLEANYIELINTEISSSGIYGIVNYGRDISADSLKLDSNGLFRNQDGGGNVGNINISSLLEVINAERFINNGNITADTLTITTDEFSNNHNGNTQLGKIVVTDIFSLSTPNASYTNTGTVATDSLNLTTSGNFDHESGILGNFTFNNLSIIADNYTQGVTIDIAGDISIQVSGEASLDDNASIKANNLFFSVYDLYNQADFTITGNATLDIQNQFHNGFALGLAEYDGGDIIANSFTITTESDFRNQYNGTISADSFTITTENDLRNQQNATLTANNLNIVVGKYMYNEGGIINANNLSITTNSTFYNFNGTINADNFDATARQFVNFLSSDKGNVNANVFNLFIISDHYYGGNINVNTFNLQVEDDFEYNSGDGNWNLNDTTLDFRVGGKFIYNNQYSDFVWKANNRLVADGHSSTSEIIAKSFTNSGTIDVEHTLDISVVNDFDYAGTIDATSFNLQVGGDFRYNDPNNDFVWNVSDSLVVEGSSFITANSFLNNGEITTDTLNLSVAGDFDYASDYLDNGNITATNQNFTARNGDFINDTSIDLVGNLGITADNFSNIGGDIIADTFSLSVADDFDYDGTINATSYNFRVGGNFSYDDPSNDFVWGSSDSLVVEGISFITVNSFLNNGEITADTLNLSVAGDFDYASDYLNNGNIAATHQNFTARDGDFTNNTSIDLVGNLGITANGFINTGGMVNADTFALSVAGDFDYTTAYLGNGTITTNAFNLNVGGNFTYNDASSDFIWKVSDSLTVLGNATINAFNYDQYGVVDVTGRFDATTNSFLTHGNADLDVDNGFYVTAENVFFGSGSERVGNSTVNTDTFDLTINGDHFQNWATVNAGNGRINVNGIFFNISIGEINVTNNFDITADKFDNERDVIVGNTLTVTLINNGNNVFNSGSVFVRRGIVADTFNLSVAGNFDYVSDFKNQKPITTNAFNLTVGGNFVNDFRAVDFTLGERDNLTVLGTASVVADSFNNSGTINVTNSSFDITATDLTNTGTINTNTLAIKVGGIVDNDATINTTSLTIDTGSIHNSGDITANSFLNINAIDDVFSGGSITTNALDIETGRNFANGGTISTNSLEVTAGYTAINQGSIVSGSLDVTTDDFFRNLTGGDISVDSLNITAGGKVTNTATIDVSGILTITANNDSTRDDDPAGSFFYVSNRGNITATDLNIAAVDNFYNRGNITADNFQITRAKSVFFLNEEIDSFVGTYDGGDISLNGDSSFTADSEIENYGNIDLGSNILDISADSFTNHAGATITDGTLDIIDVKNFNDYGSITAIINQ